MSGRTLQPHIGASRRYGEVTAICWNPGDRSRLMFIVWLCLVKRKHYIVAALTIFGRFNGESRLLFGGDIFRNDFSADSQQF